MEHVEQMGISAKELIEYMKKYGNAEEFIEGANGCVKEFIRDVATLAENMSNLYEASKVALAMVGVVVKVEVVAGEEQFYKMELGNSDSAEMVQEMLRKIAEAR